MKPELIPEAHKDKFENIFFNRPIGPLHRKNIGIILGKYVDLYAIDIVYTIIRALNHHPIIIADESLRAQLVPAEFFLKKNDKNIKYTNTDEAVEIINNCHIILAGLGLEVNAALQIFLERLFQSSNVAVILTENLLRLPILVNYLNENKLIIGSTRAFLRLKDSKLKPTSIGLCQKIEILKEISVRYRINILCSGQNQYVAFDLVNNQIGIVNNEHIELHPLVAIMISLMAGQAKPILAGWRDYFLAASYLYKNYYQGSKQPLKKLSHFLSL